MTTLLPDECRVLGTLIEKALTTPGQYPLSLNSLVTGVNQKSNRDPVVEIDEERALRAIDGLRAKGLARDVTFTGSRVEKYRHTAGEALELRPPALAILAELLLRGPQTVGELRGRASRMHPLDSLEAVEAVLATLAQHSNAMVREIPPLSGSRAMRWMQLLCESLHPQASHGSTLTRATSGIDAAHSNAHSATQQSSSHSASSSSDATEALTLEVAALRARVEQLESTMSQLQSLLT